MYRITLFCLFSFYFVLFFTLSCVGNVNPPVPPPSTTGGDMSGATDGGTTGETDSGTDGGTTGVSGPWPFLFRGDTNCDGHLNNFDIHPFDLARNAPEEYEANYPFCSRWAADMNENNVIDDADLEIFINQLGSL